MILHYKLKYIKGKDLEDRIYDSGTYYKVLHYDFHIKIISPIHFIYHDYNAEPTINGNIYLITNMTRC